MQQVWTVKCKVQHLQQGCYLNVGDLSWWQKLHCTQITSEESAHHNLATLLISRSITLLTGTYQQQQQKNPVRTQLSPLAVFHSFLFTSANTQSLTSEIIAASLSETTHNPLSSTYCAKCAAAALRYSFLYAAVWNWICAGTAEQLMRLRPLPHPTSDRRASSRRRRRGHGALPSGASTLAHCHHRRRNTSFANVHFTQHHGDPRP